MFAGKIVQITPEYDMAFADLTEGLSAWRMWGRLGWLEIKRRYRRTVIGPFWTTLSLGIFIAVLGVVWAGLWRQDPKTYLPFLTAGMLAWTMVAGIISEACSTFVAGAGLITQLRFPYSILCCSVAWRHLIVFLHNLVIFAIVALYGNVPITAASLLLIPALAFVFVNGIWVSLLVGMLCARFRDMQQVIVSLLQISMFITPIFFTAEMLGPQFRSFVDLNALFHYVDIVRSPLLGRAPAAWSWFVVLAGTVVGWGMTVWLFSRFRRRVAYWL
jgi:ABC-type polysaccharide/polyol phosphate export permease